jgi:hypothetical protein
VTLLDPGPELAPVLEALIELGHLLATGSQELVKALAVLRSGTPGVSREDAVDFLEAIHRIAGVEREADTARRRVAAMLARSAIPPPQIYVASECAARLERASDVLLSIAFSLRDHVLGDTSARPR